MPCCHPASPGGALPSLPRDWTRCQQPSPQKGTDDVPSSKNPPSSCCLRVKLWLSRRWEPQDEGSGLWPETLHFPSKSV